MHIPQIRLEKDVRPSCKMSTFSSTTFALDMDWIAPLILRPKSAKTMRSVGKEKEREGWGRWLRVQLLAQLFEWEKGGSRVNPEMKMRRDEVRRRRRKRKRRRRRRRVRR